MAAQIGHQGLHNVKHLVQCEQCILVQVIVVLFLVREVKKEVGRRMAEGAELKSENWEMVVSEQHRYQGVSYKSDIIVISGNNHSL